MLQEDLNMVFRKRGEEAIGGATATATRKEEIVNVRFVVVKTTTMDDVLASGLPDPARHLADLIDAEMGGTTSCGGSGGVGYVPDIVEVEE